MKALLFQHALKLLGDFGTPCLARCGPKFDDGHSHRADQTEPSSRPITPAPTMRSFPGTFPATARRRGDDRLLVDCDAGKLDDIGACRDDDIFRFEPLDRTIQRLHIDRARGLDRALPDKASILFFLKRKPTPLTLAATVSSLCFIIRGEIELRLAGDHAKPARSCRASANFSDAGAAPSRECSRC